MKSVGIVRNYIITGWGRKCAMKTIPVKKLFLLFLIIIFFLPGIILAGDQSQQKKAIQKIEQKNINHTIEDDKDTPKGQVSTEADTFDYDPLIYLFGIFVSAFLIIWQIDRQHKNNFKLQRGNNREKLRLEIYKDYRKTISRASNKIVSASTNAIIIVTHFNIFVNQVSRGIPHMPISNREPAFHEVHFAAINSITDLIIILEEYEIINPNLEIFRIAFSYASHCMSEAFKPFHLVLLEFLPYDVPLQDQSRLGTDVIIPKVPSKEDLKKISETAQPYIDAAMEAGCYVSDLAKEAQNIFIGSLFPHRLPPRKPIDPRHVVISTVPQEVAKLKKYFFEETEWGKNKKRVEEKIRKAVKKNNPNTYEPFRVNRQ